MYLLYKNNSQFVRTKHNNCLKRSTVHIKVTFPNKYKVDVNKTKVKMKMFTWAWRCMRRGESKSCRPFKYFMSEIRTDFFSEEEEEAFPKLETIERCTL